jgi:hypothetical protein
MLDIHRHDRTNLIAATLALLALFPAGAAAQLNGQNLKGDAGLKSGSQPPPGAYVSIPLWFYTADAIKNRDGDEILTGNLDAAIFGAALTVVTQKKILGATYGFTVALPWANNRVQGVEDFDSNPGAGLTDMFVQPINLGWRQKRADVTAAYGIYLPVGRYENGADNNTGLGMWGHELLIGSTVYLNEQRSLHAATTASFDFQSKKEDSDTKVGNILNLEGGVGADFLGGGLTAGLTYFGVFKLTEDEFDSRLPSVLIRGKNSIWGLGPEFTLALASKKKKAVYGFVTVRYQWELAGRTSTEGAVWNILATFPLKPIPIP